MAAFEGVAGLVGEVGGLGRFADEAAGGARLARGCSFAGDTPVTLADGTTKPIAEVREGESVLAWDEASGTTGSYRVVATWAHADPATAYLTIDGDRLLATPEHPFFTRERGWVPAGLLQVGEHIRKAAGGWGVVRAVRSDWDAGTRYNLTVETAHTYAVGDGGWVVHNSDGCRGARRLWEITAEHTDRVMIHQRFGRVSRHADSGLWWSRDNANHGGSVWKVFREERGGRRWVADADEYGDFIVGKHKGDTGLFIPWSELRGVGGR